MNKQHRFLLFIWGLLCVSALVVWPGRWPPSAYANVTLVGFTGVTFPGQPEVYIKWETATEFDTLGFFITRSDRFDGEFARVSDFIHHEGDPVVGANYEWADETTALNRLYLYQLEEITSNQSSEFYGPITVTTGTLVGVDPTATATRTPTRTPTPTLTATPVTQSTTEAASPTKDSGGAMAVTPRVVTGATVTPRPGSPATSSPADTPATRPVQAPDAPPQPTAPPENTEVAPAMPDATALSDAPVPGAAPGVDVAQAPDPTLSPPDAVPVVNAPAVVVTEAAPAIAAATGSNHASVLLLVAAALLFLGMGFFILRQIRQ